MALEGGTSTRKIIHVDMDAFYASVEQRDRPELRGKPVVVGGHPQSRGVVSAASYEARKFGVRSAISCAQAYRLCPQAVFVFPNFDKYLAVSRELRKIFESYTPWVEPLALDEAYLDVTQNLVGEPLAKNIAISIRKRIQDELHLTASAGVGPNKFIAKLASEMKKPNGLVVIPPEKVASVVENLAVEKLWGVGPATAERLNSIGIRTAADIRRQPLSHLEKVIGSHARFLYGLAHGEDDREVDPSFDPKSRGTETTFDRDILDADRLLDQLQEQATEVSADLKKLERPGRTVTLKIKYANFSAITRSRTIAFPTDDASEIFKIVSELLYKDTEVGTRPVRLIGISVSNLVDHEEPLQLWFEFPVY